MLKTKFAILCSAALFSMHSHAALIQIDYSSASAHNFETNASEEGTAKFILNDQTGDVHGFEFLFPSLFVTAGPIEDVRLNWDFDGSMPIFGVQGFYASAQFDLQDGSDPLSGSLEVWDGQWEAYGDISEDPLALFLANPFFSMFAFADASSWGLNTQGVATKSSYPPLSTETVTARVPEPATLALLGLGLLALNGARRSA